MAFAIADSPSGLLAWHAQLLPDDLDPDFVLANVATYWFTRTAASAIRFYYEDAHATEHPQSPTTVPTALAMFAGDFESIRPFAERDHANIDRWSTYDRGGHYAAHQASDLFVRVIRAFFASLR